MSIYYIIESFNIASLIQTVNSKIKKKDSPHGGISAVAKTVLQR